MMYDSPIVLRFPGWPGIGLVGCILLATGCVEPEDGLEKADYFEGDRSESTVSEPVGFTDQPYDDISGEMTIAQLRGLVPDEFVWFGFDTPYPVEGDCDPYSFHDQEPAIVGELPVTIEGVVTLHPRYFSNLDFCGSRQRYQGSYVIQDETGGIQVLQDSRVADVDVGDHIRMRVRGVGKVFDTEVIVAFEDEEALTDRNAPRSLYYEEIDREFDEEQDLYEVRRVSGEVVVEPTNQNFGELVVESTDDPDVQWRASLDREMTNRGVGPDEGDIVELTGPVVDSFGPEIILARLGQIEVLEEADD